MHKLMHDRSLLVMHPATALMSVSLVGGMVSVIMSSAALTTHYCTHDSSALGDCLVAALKSLAILLSPPVVSTQLDMILSPAKTLFLQKLVDMVGLGRHVDRSLSQSLPALGTCQVLGMISGIKTLARHLSSAALCRTTALVRCLFMGSSQCLSGAGSRSAYQVLVSVGARSTCQVLVGVAARSACQVLVGYGARSACQVLVGYGARSAWQVLIDIGACSTCQVLVDYGACSACQVLFGVGGHSACQLLVGVGVHSACQVLVGVGARSACQVLVGVGVHSACQVLVGVGACSACQVLVGVGACHACQVLVGVGARSTYQVLGGVGVIVYVTWTLLFYLYHASPGMGHEYYYV